ncbi:hypothetical protein BS47DRAFT_1487378 [Hydnum rufescens UP504]|uniref:glutathione transferase n=1 Tax=Hydnum rufescens UP504 TaxID=1448309 RepID=A0A9P6DTK0_9AGAM|nr:hypothetical protein BS47DRAFT_1487378 [Hydnum rufescens UP504]
MASNVQSEALVLHHLGNSRSQRILWLLEELEIPYTIKAYPRLPSGEAPPELRAVHPMGKSPVITDGNVVLAESGAIVEYIIKKYDSTGKLQTSKSTAVVNTYYTHFSEGSLMVPFTFKYIMNRAPELGPWLLRPLIRYITNTLSAAAADPSIEGSLDMIEEHLSKLPEKTYFAGGSNPTSADFMMIFPLELSIQLLPQLVDTKRHLKAYVEMIHQLPAFKRGIEKGGSYSYAN